MRSTGLKLMAAAAAVVVFGAGCSDDGSDTRDDSDASGSASGSGSGSGSGSASAGGEPACDPVGDPSTSDSDVALELGEWFVEADPPEIAAGSITFLGENVGAESHEFVISSQTPEELPTDENGAVIEEEAEDGIIGEVEAFPSQSACDGTFALEPGTYTIFCNIVETEEDGEIESHFAEGMVTTIEVT